MLKGKRSVSACSLSSCRIRAEALARAFNNRIWPCVWISQRSSDERDDGMSKGIEDEEEFFDASPSPVELEDESLFCQQHSSAATEAGRAKLYELLQQHAADDAIDVFYDVSEDAAQNATACDTCLNDSAKKSNQILYESSRCSENIKDESYFPNNSDGNGKAELMFSNNNEIADNPVKIEKLKITDSELLETKYQQTALESSEDCCLNTELNDVIRNDLKTDEKRLQNVIKTEKAVSDKDETKNSVIRKKNSLSDGDEMSEEKKENNIIADPVKNTDMPSSEFNCVAPLTNHNCISNDEKHPENISELLFGEKPPESVTKDEAQVTVEVDSPSSSSDVSDAKAISPTSRLKVFEEFRPQILRSTSLKTGKTPPGTPSRKKIVRFADALGLDLEDVRHIMSSDVPIIPSSAYTDLNLKDVDLPSYEPISETVEINRRDSSNWQGMQGTTATNVLYPQFSVPGEQPDFLDRVRHQGVCLETVLVSEMNIQCTCKVMNYGYYKKVIARYTVNNWLSCNDIDASFVSGSSSGETDTFAFSIFLSPLNKTVQFALKYEVNGKEYWDNNRNQNYRLSYHGDDNMHQIPSPVWHHQF